MQSSLFYCFFANNNKLPFVSLNVEKLRVGE